MLERRVESVEQRAAAMERAIMVAMQEVDNTRAALTERMDELQQKCLVGESTSTPSHKEENRNNNNNNNNMKGVTRRQLEEVLHVAAEALAVSTAQKKKLELHEVHFNALEKEVVALCSRVENSIYAVGILPKDNYDQQQEEERRNLFNVVSPYHNSPQRDNNKLYSSTDNIDLIHQLQKRITQLEYQQTLWQNSAQPKLDTIEENIGSMVETHVRQLLREQQQQQQEEKSKNGLDSNKQQASPFHSTIISGNNNRGGLVSSPSSGVHGTLDVRTLRIDIDVLRQDLVRCVVEIEKVMDQQQRLGTRVHSCVNTIQRQEAELQSIAEEQKSLLQSQVAHLEMQQTTALARQEKQLAAERHRLHTEMTAEVHRVCERQSEMMQQTEKQRLETLSASYDRLRDELRLAVHKQQEELRLAVEQMEETIRRLQREMNTRQLTAAQQVQEVTSQALSTGNDHLQRIVHETQADLRRLQHTMEDRAEQQQQFTKYMEETVQKRIGDEVRRVRIFTSDTTVRLQQQVEEEVQRYVRLSEQELLAEIRQDIERIDAAVKLLEEQQLTLREAMQAAVAPSSTMASLDQRVSVLRADFKGLCLQLQEIQHNLHTAEEVGLTPHILGKQQRMLLEDVMEIKSRLRQCEAKQIDPVKSHHTNIDTARVVVVPHFVGDNASQSTPVRPGVPSTINTRTNEKTNTTNINTTNTIGEGRMEGSSVRAFRSPGVFAGLNQSAVVRNTPGAHSSVNGTFDPLAGVFD